MVAVVVACVITVAFNVVAAREGAVTGECAVASSGSHLWWCVEDSGGVSSDATTPGSAGPRFTLYLARSSSAADAPMPVASLPSLPTAMAAHGGDIWLGLRDQSGGTTIYRASAAQKNPTTGMMAGDAVRLQPVAALATAPVTALAADALGAVILDPAPSGGVLSRVVPLGVTPFAVAGIGADALQGQLASWPADGALAREGRGGWAITRDEGGDLVVMAPASEEQREVTLHSIRIGDAAGWRAVPGSRLPAVWKELDGLLQVKYARESSLATVGAFPAEASGSAVAFLDGETGGFVALRAAPVEGGFQAWRMHATSGAVAPLVWTPAPVIEESVLWWQLPLIGGLTVLAVVVLILMRPGRSGVLRTMLPEGWEPLPIQHRAFAFIIDALPLWLALVLIRNDVDVSRWMAWPAWSGDPSSTLWGLAFIAALTLSSAVQESLMGTSIGKRLVGAGIVGLAGSTTGGVRAPRGRTFARALLRAAILLAPALAFLTLIDPSLCGVPEVVTKTAVARRARQRDQAPARDR